MFAALAVVGLLLLATALLIALGDVGGMSGRMPTQVPPRLALYPLVAGGLALVIGVVGLIIP